MISSSSSPDRGARPHVMSATGHPATRSLAAHVSSPVQISTADAAFLRAELQRQPEIRPEVVARARQLAADPNYPSPKILKNVARQILASPDLSEERS